MFKHETDGKKERSGALKSGCAPTTDQLYINIQARQSASDESRYTPRTNEGDVFLSFEILEYA
jgi:hypothetical protein